MEVASVIISTLSLIISILCICLMLAKNFFSSHTIQYVDPFKGNDPINSEIGSKLFSEFRDIGDPIDSDELDLMKDKLKKKLR